MGSIRAEHGSKNHIVGQTGIGTQLKIPDVPC